MKIISITSKAEVAKYRGENVPVMAIDLGFSGRKETTGYACSPDSPDGEAIKYSEALSRVARIAEEHSQSILILEAPLCGRFEDGNPIARGPFEEAATGTRPKHWNIGAGAAVALAAIHFLLHLNEKLRSCNSTIYLIEGFISGDNKPKLAKGRASKTSQHAADAALLLQSFNNDTKCDDFIETGPADDVLVTTRILGIESDCRPAIILKPRPRQ